MPLIDFTLDCPVDTTSFRVQQLAGLFDLPLFSRPSEHFRAELPDLDEPWQIGLIVGPSGSGKSTLARRAYGDHLYTPAAWPGDRAMIDCFPAPLAIRQITQTLTAVGFSSPPSWLKPYAVLSTGQKFRCDLARALLVGSASADGIVRDPTAPGAAKIPSAKADPTPLVVFDEFTSTVDRTVARIGSAAVAKAIRTHLVPTKRFVAITCHYDVLAWLTPDWTLDLSTGHLARDRLHDRRRRPPIHLHIRRVPRDMWNLFKRHHYLSASLHPRATCFAGFIALSSPGTPGEGKGGGSSPSGGSSSDLRPLTSDLRPATFTAVLPFPHPTRPGYKEHRTVCLPDYQGIGLGSAMSEFIAACYASTGKPYFSTTGHPALIHHRARSPLWRMTRKPLIGVCPHGRYGPTRAGSVGRMTAGFEYVGPPRPVDALKLDVPSPVMRIKRAAVPADGY